MRSLLAALPLVILCGCGTVLAKRTTYNLDGTTTVDSIKATAFLETVKQGTYASGSGMMLTITDASPDQESIKILTDGVVSLASKFADRQSTNSPSGTNAAAAKH